LFVVYSFIILNLATLLLWCFSCVTHFYVLFFARQFLLFTFCLDTKSNKKVKNG